MLVVQFPNHTAYRHIAAALAILLMTMAARWTKRTTAIIFGVGIAVAVMLNLEVGVAASCGLLAYFIFRFFFTKSNWFGALKVGGGSLRFLVTGMAVAIGAFVIAYRLIQHEWICFSYSAKFIEHLQLTMRTGYSSWSGADFSPLATLIFAHASLAIIYAFATRRHGGHRQSLRVGVSTFMMIWFTYYANRPAREYLYCYYCPYGILLADTLRTISCARRMWRRQPVATICAMAALVLILGPLLFKSLPLEMTRYWDRSRVLGSQVDGISISGVQLPDDQRSRLIEAKAALIAAARPNGPVVYLTNDCYLIPTLAHAWPAIPFIDVYLESITASSYYDLLDSIKTSPVNRIFIDDPAGMIQGSDPGASNFFIALRFNLSETFEFSSREQGWEVWERRRH